MLSHEVNDTHHLSKDRTEITSVEKHKEVEFLCDVIC